jgi:TM2 domain-containing membrane protein YozV
MRVIFISYRRSDSDDVTGRIYDALTSKFSEVEMFMDFDKIPLGVSFPQYLKSKLKRAEVTLVIIGPAWVDAADKQGRRRLDDPNDWVRIEIETALRSKMPVIPILVSRANLPKESELPESLRALVSRQATEVRPGRDFKSDMENLFTRLNELQKLLDRRSGRSGAPAKDRIPTVLPAPENDGRAGPDKLLASDPPKDPAFMCILSFLLVGLGQFVLGQKAKGMVMLLGALILGTFTLGIAFVLIWALSAYDAYRIAVKLKSGNPVGQWEFF